MRARERYVWSISTLFAIFGLALAVLVVPDLPRMPSRLQLDWWHLAPVFALTALATVHFQFRSQARTVTLDSLPLVLGLFFAGPVGLVVARALGGFAIVVRRARPLKTYVNTTIFLLESVLGLVVFTALRGDADSPVFQTWVAAYAAILVGEVAAHVLITIAIGVMEGRVDVRESVGPLAFAAVVGMLTTSLGLLAVAAAWYDPAFVWLLALVAVVAAAGYRSYADLLERHAGLGRLYRFQAQLAPLRTRAEELFPVLERTRDLLIAEYVELTLLNDNEHDSTHQLVLHADGSREERLAGSGLPPRALVASPAGLRVRSEDLDRLQVDLTVAGRLVGTLEVRHRLGDVRPFNGSDLRLLETLGSHVSTALEKGSLLEQLELAATHDALTGLLTLAELSRDVDERLVQRVGGSLIMLDVVRLQDVNDSLGYDAGDAVLRVVADRLLASLPAGAIAARAGGDEFVAFVPGNGLSAGVDIATGLLDALGRLVEVVGVTVDVRVRAGYCVAPADGIDASTLLRRAEAALGEARRAFQPLARFHSGLERDSGRRLRLVADLRAALADERGDEVFVVFQPLVDARTRHAVGAEALARWMHPTLGPVAPDEFIPLAEQTGQITHLTDVVLDRALAQARAWIDAGRPLRVSVNMSARCLHDLGLTHRVFDALARHRVPAHMLCLEITESSMAEDPIRAQAVLERLRTIGVRLSVDDFGTGYSSLAHLRVFPVQEVKLDKQFLQGLGERDGDDALLTAIVQLGHALGLEIVAEGVENERILDRVVSLGVDVLQGYHFGRPVRSVEWPATSLDVVA